ncbi:MAG: hypothetical protein Q4P33_03920 [Flaviflexus sp.]|nr:hypothetical protein [Flaviflexus sp.]
MVSFLIVAPLKPANYVMTPANMLEEMTAKPEERCLEDETEGLRMATRVSFATQTLVQCWDELDSPQFEGMIADDQLIKVTAAAISTCRGKRFLAADVELEDYRTDGKQIFDDVLKLEKTLSKAGVKIAELAHEIGDESPMWVGRYLRLTQDEAIPEGWLLGSPRVVRIDHEEHSFKVHLAWGNSVLFVEKKERTKDWDSLVRGLIDAQVIWIELDSLATISHRNLINLYSGYEGMSLRQRSLFYDQLGEYQGLLALHQLSYDELKLSVQGVRREVAVSLLEAWGYSGVLGRVDRRIQDAQAVALSLQAKSERGYRKLIEWILAFLAILGLVEFALSVISTAYSGPSRHVPGHDSPMHIMQYIRTINADIIVAVAMVLALLAGFRLFWQFIRGRKVVGG